MFVVFTGGVLLIIWLCCYSGWLIYAKYHSCDPLTTQLAKAKDQLLPLLVMDVLGEFPGLPGLFVAGVFSAALSSLSTGLNSMAAVVLEDFYKPYSSKPLTNRQTNILMKTVVIAFGALCVGLVFVVERLGTVLQLSLSLSALANGPMLAIFLMGLLLPWINSEGALAGGISGLLGMCWIVFGSQTAIATGNIYFPEKPVMTDGCHYTFTPKESRFNIQMPNTTEDIQHTDEVLMLYRLSYMWYTVIGCVFSMAVGLIVSLIYKPNDAQKVDKRLLAPFVRRILEKNTKPTRETQSSKENEEDTV